MPCQSKPASVTCTGLANRPSAAGDGTEEGQDGSHSHSASKRSGDGDSAQSGRLIRTSFSVAGFVSSAATDLASPTGCASSTFGSVFSVEDMICCVVVFELLRRRMLDSLFDAHREG